MVEKVEVTINVIVHATEDVSKIFAAFEEVFGLDQEDFIIQNITGHFDNPITTVNAKLVKRKAMVFIQELIENISENQINEMIDEIEERTVDSRFHIRIDKQEMIQGRIIFKEKDAVKIKIHVPIYNKKDTVKVFTRLFQTANEIK